MQSADRVLPRTAPFSLHELLCQPLFFLVWLRSKEWAFLSPARPGPGDTKEVPLTLEGCQWPFCDSVSLQTLSTTPGPDLVPSLLSNQEGNHGASSCPCTKRGPGPPFLAHRAPRVWPHPVSGGAGEGVAAEWLWGDEGLRQT